MCYWTASHLRVSVAADAVLVVLVEVVRPTVSLAVLVAMQVAIIALMILEIVLSSPTLTLR